MKYFFSFIGTVGHNIEHFMGGKWNRSFGPKNFSKSGQVCYYRSFLGLKIWRFFFDKWPVEFCSISIIQYNIWIRILRFSPLHSFAVTLREGMKPPEMVCDVFWTTKTKTKTKSTSNIGSWYLAIISAAYLDIYLQMRRNL